MPLTINVGLSRKTSANYNSTGTSINLTAELDQSLLTQPDQLQDAITALYQRAEDALQRQANGPARHADHDQHRGNGNDNGHNTPSTGMTASQRRAIHAIADRLGVDPSQEAVSQFGIELKQMTVREASMLIDHLKALQPVRKSGNGSNGGR